MEVDIRAEAVLWLREELQLMNDEGAHWVQGAYIEGGGLQPAMCIKGASNAVLYNKAKAKDESKFISLLADDEDLEGPPELEYVGGMSYLLRSTAKEIDPILVQIQDAVEIALNLAINQVEQLSLKPVLDFGAIHGEEVITRFNDDVETDWEDVVRVHELAVELCSSGKSPLNWREFGATLAKL